MKMHVKIVLIMENKSMGRQVVPAPIQSHLSTTQTANTVFVTADLLQYNAHFMWE